MASDLYFGKYVRFDTSSKDEGSQLMGADSLVGDRFSINFVVEDGQTTAWLKNKFGAPVGFFDETTTRTLSLYQARGFKMYALLSFVAYEDHDGGSYWGQAALVCFDPAHEAAFEAFIDGVSRRLAEGIRPQVDISAQGVRQIIDSEGTWQPKKTIPFPSKQAGVALVKTKQSMTEKLVEQGRARNKGCYLGTFVVFALVIAGVLFGLHSCGVF